MARNSERRSRLGSAYQILPPRRPRKKSNTPLTARRLAADQLPRRAGMRDVGRQPPARRLEVEPVGPPRRAPGEQEDFAPVGPDAQVCPEARAVDLNGPLGDPLLRDIGFALPQEPTQPRMPDRGAVDEPAARESAPGLEDEVGFAPR